MTSLTPRQLQVVTFIRRFSAQHGFAPTLAEIARHLGVIKATVQQYLQALEDKGVITRKRYSHRSIELVPDAFDSDEERELMLLGRIAAGEPIEAIETPEPTDVETLLGLRRNRETFLLQVKGDSMIDDGIFDGDYVVVERRETAENGQTVVALLPDGSATLKRFYREGGKIRLQPANPRLKPKIVTRVSIQGVVRGVVRSLDRPRMARG
jgi:repressor LexA